MRNAQVSGPVPTILSGERNNLTVRVIRSPGLLDE